MKRLIKHGHKQVSRREFQRWMVFGVTKGLSIVKKIKQFQPGVLRGQVVLNSVTTWFTQIGQMAVVMAMLLLLVLLSIKTKIRVGE